VGHYRRQPIKKCLALYLGLLSPASAMAGGPVHTAGNFSAGPAPISSRTAVEHGLPLRSGWIGPGFNVGGSWSALSDFRNVQHLQTTQMSAAAKASTLGISPAAALKSGVASPQLSTRSWVSQSSVASSASPSLFDLTSPRTNILLGADILARGRTVTIDVGGSAVTFAQGSFVTAAEYVAIKQVLGAGITGSESGGGQTIILSKQGTASGGEFNLVSQLSQHVSELVVPQGVTAIDNVSGGKNLTFSGDLINSGSIYIESSNVRPLTASISALDIINEPGGIISSVAPGVSGVFSPSASLGPAHISLALTVLDSLVNAGTIFSAADLSLKAPTAGQSLSLTNSGGIISAPSGQISLTSGGNISLVGGDLTAKSVVFQAPTGAVNVLGNSIFGQVSVKANTSNIQVATGDLDLQSVAVKNDPIFVNAKGNVNLPATITNSGGPVTVIAAQNIIGAAGTGTTIDTSTTDDNPAGTVTLLAGTASVTAGGVTSASGPSGLSGGISGITSINASSTSGGAGGSVTLGAFGGGIDVGSITSGSKSGFGGVVTLLAPGNIQVGDITVHGQHQATTYIDIETANPNLGAGLKYDSSGNLTQGTISTGAAGGGSITTGNLDAGNEINDGYRGGDINIVAGGAVTTGWVRSLGGGSVGGAPAALGYNYGFPGGDGGNISVVANGGSALINGDINTSGGGGGGSNVSVGGAGGDGGNVTLTASGNVTVNGPVLSPGGGGGGGSGISSEDTPGGGGSLGNGGGPDSGGLFFSPPPYEGPGQNSSGPVVGNPNHPPFPYPGMGGSNTAYDIGCCGGGYGGNVGNYGNNGTSGTFQKGTFDDITAHPGGAPGLGGNITIAGNSVSITKTIGTFYGAKAVLSPYADYSVFAHSALGGGQVSISATGSHVTTNAYAVDGDLSTANQDAVISVTPNAVTLAGKTEGNTVTFNGNSMAASLPAGSYAGTGNGQIQISENGSAKFLTNGQMVTPSELIAAIQISSLGGQLLSLGASGQAVGGAFTIATANLPGGGFSNLLIPTNVTAAFNTPSVNVSGNTVISGTVELLSNLQLTTSGLQLNNNASINTAASAVNFAAITPVLNLGGGSTIVVSGNTSITAPASSGLQILVPNGATATVSSGAGAAGQILFDGNGQAVNISNSTATSTGILSLLGSPVAVNASTFTLGSQTEISLNSPLTITSSAGSIINNGSIVAVSKTGSGGTVTLQSPGALAVTLGALSLGPSAVGGGSGGVLSILAPQGALTISSGSINLDAAGTTAFNGGSLTVVGDGLAVSGSGALAISANGVGGGNGGQVSITNLASQNLTIGSGAISISANGGAAGSASGDGGSVTLASGGNLYIGMSAIQAGPLGLSGAGGHFSFVAGTNGSGLVAVTGNIDASGKGTGDGGSILLASNSALPLSVTAAGGNGVSGFLDADAGAGALKGGAITLQNLGSGGVTIAATSKFSALAPTSGGAGGSLTILSSAGPLTIAAGSYSFAGSGSAGAGGAISITAQSLITSGSGQLVLVASGAGTGNGGTINIALPGDNAPLLLAGQGTADAVSGSLAILAQSGNLGGDGGHVSLTTGGAISIDPTAILFNAQGTNGNGGSLAISAGTFTNPGASPLVLDASGHGTGNGGQLNISLSAQNALNLSSTGDMQLLASGGGTAGSGGSISVSIAGQLSMASDGTGLKVAPLAASGNGGSVSLMASSLSPVGTGPGGAAYGPLIVNASGVGTGDGGFINIALSAGNTINIGQGVGQLELVAGSGASGGNGGSIAVVEKGGALIIDPSAIAVAPMGKNGSGGSINFSFDNISWANMSVAPLVLNVAGKGAGNGGTVEIVQTGAVSSSIGKGPGQLTLLAPAGKGGGNGGSVIVKSGADLSVSPASLSVSASGSKGNGGTIELDAGTAGSGNLFVSGALNASGVGKGLGGEITLSSNSVATFMIGGPLKTIQNGVAGALTAGGSVGGAISISNLGGGIQVRSSLSRFGNLNLTDGSQGSILLGAALGGTMSKSIVFNQDGSGDVLSLSSSAISAANVAIFTSNAGGVDIIGGVVPGKHGAPPTDTGALVVNTANLSLPAAGLVDIKDTARLATVNQSGNTSGDFKFSGAGKVFVEGSLNVGGNLTIAAGSSGSISLTGQSPLLTAASVDLVSGRLGTGSPTQALSVDTGALQISGSGAVYISDSFAGTLNLATSSIGGALVLSTAGDINVAGVVHSNSGPIDLTATGSGSIYSTNSGALKAATVNFIADGGAIGVSGGAGGSGPLLTEAKTITASALGAVNISNAASASNWQNISGSSVSLTSSSAANIVDIISSAGDIRVTADSGRLATVTGAQVLANGGSIYLNGNATKGSISIGSGSFVETVGASAQHGNIFITVGNGLPQTFTGKLPLMLQISASGSGIVDLGLKGITAGGVTSNINATDQTIDFDTNGRSAGTIKINGGSNIIAGILDTNLQASTVSLERLKNLPKHAHSVVNTAIDVEIFADQDLGISGSHLIEGALDLSTPWLASAEELTGVKEKATVTDVTTFQSHELIASGRPGAQIAFESSRGQVASNDSAAPSNCGTLVGGIIYGRLKKLRAGDSSVRRLTLENGDFLFVPEKPLSIQTTFGQVNLAGGAVVLVSFRDHSLAIFDLDDRFSGSVMYVSTAGEGHSNLRPGDCMLVTSDSEQTFEEVNPTQLLGFRHISRRQLGKRNIYKAEFSLPQALNMLHGLRGMVVSTNHSARKIGTHLFKTAAILSLLDTGLTPFMPSPRFTLVAEDAETRRH
jgi:hypothetical protein